MPFMEKGLVIKNNQVDKDLYEIEFLAPQIAAKSMPGQFVQVLPSKAFDPLLRRPISLYDVNHKTASITLLYKVVGKGTEILTRIKADEYLDVMGPLGKGFTLMENKNVVLVGGGVGIAPLIYLARKLKEADCTVTVLHGTDNVSQLVTTNRLDDIGVKFMPATIDGSLGHKGYVTDLLYTKFQPNQIDYIYTCGPEAMMSLVAKYAQENNILAEVSIEEHMACGVGACLGCARKLKADDTNYIKVCQDGPVFSTNEIEI
ncbi:MAG TPA: dihydroorotate dehydrogenase electron transfer subunit [Syntrophomonadaceae bacterium]|nr:dihydroorotate dehydrogenase electron transfer subunit [Syntrophomonadaceae bacterium]